MPRCIPPPLPRHYYRFVLFAYLANAYTYLLVLRPHVSLGLGLSLDDTPPAPWGSVEGWLMVPHTIVVLALGSLLAYHTYLISTATTTIELRVRWW